MILQLGLDQTIEYIIWLIVGTIIVTLLLYLSVRIVVSKQKANDKKFMLVLISLIGLIVIPLLSGVIATLLNFIGQLPLLLPWGQNYLTNLVVIFEFLLFLIVVKFLLSEDWSDSVWIALLGLFFLYLLYSFFPILYTYIGTIV
ncbi:MAG: hypothetical protein GF364_10990 [Candidatus Lokiarchaeota archaeon]|nr:hypothetical protein [Candidatus Lokiarchaeota archaeon]